MSKECKCGKNCECAKEEKFYLGVNDQIYYRAHYDVFNKEVVLKEDEEIRANAIDVGDCKETDPFHVRFFAKKFVNDPMLAALNAWAEDSRESNNPETRKWFMENVRYCKENSCFYIDEYLTLGVELPPKACQWEKFFKGEYEFLVVRHEIQVLRTVMPKIDLNTIGKGIGFDTKVKEMPDPVIEEKISLDEDMVNTWSIRYKLNEIPIERFKM